jgi:hypothetical protein
MQEENKPTLKLVSVEGETVQPKGKRSSKLTTGTGLTEKQEAFANGLAEGLTNAEAYRRAYGAENMKPATVHSEACKQAQHPKVAARVDALLAEKRARNSMETDRRREKNSDRVWRGVWRLCENVEGNVPPAVQQSALALAAKMAGMLTDQVKIESVSADSSAIEKELTERLQRLARSA